MLEVKKLSHFDPGRPEEGAQVMRRFVMYRLADLSATHNALQANPSEEPQFEGVVFTDGKVAIRWLTQCRSTSVWDSFEDVMAIHGHPEYESKLIWLDIEDLHLDLDRDFPFTAAYGPKTMAILKGEATQKKITCPVCGGKEVKKWGRGFGTWDVYECDCGERFAIGYKTTPGPTVR